MSRRRIYVEHDYSSEYGRFWSNLGDVIRDREEFLSSPQSFDLVGFTGGEDVTPDLYGHKNVGSHCSLARDKREVTIFEMARKHDIPMTGICRGSQFLNVMCGGTLIQDFRGHGGRTIQRVLETGETMEVSCSHHQIVVPGPDCEIVAISDRLCDPKRARYDGELPEVMIEGEGLRVTEAYAYPKQRIFAVQHHPEWQNIDEEAPQWTLDMIARICWGEEERQRTLDEIMDVFGA